MVVQEEMQLRHFLSRAQVAPLLSGAEPFVQFLTSFFFCFLALRPKPTAMVMAGRSVHLTTLFPGQT